MISRMLAGIGIAAGACAVIFSPSAASAVPVEIDLSLSFSPPVGTAEWSLIGTGDIFVGDTDLPTVAFRPGRQKPGKIVIIKFIPGDPCVGDGTCGVSFSFAGTTDEGGSDHPSYGFQMGNVPSSDPGSAPELFVGLFVPTDPCFSGGVCHATGPIVAFSDPLTVGQWDVTIEAATTPLPATLPLFASGLGALGLLGWRRKRKNAAALAA